ncbi:MAG: ATP-grasp domain-containing protein [Vicinamibacterales bacterium]
MEALTGHQAAILEKVIDFALEFSVVAARGIDDGFAHYGAIENVHRNPHPRRVGGAGRVPPASVDEAVAVTRAIMDELAYVGVLCVEFFLTTEGRILVNEIAPRPHNSGHLTVDAAITSQFEQQVRAVCGLPLRRHHPAQGRPRWPTCSATGGRRASEVGCRARRADVKLHLYLGVRPHRPGARWATSPRWPTRRPSPAARAGGPRRARLAPTGCRDRSRGHLSSPTAPRSATPARVAGVVIVTPDGRVTGTGGGAALTTNNKMEADRRHQEALNRLREVARPLAVYTDSTYVIRASRAGCTTGSGAAGRRPPAA